MLAYPRGERCCSSVRECCSSRSVVRFGGGKMDADPRSFADPAVEDETALRQRFGALAHVRQTHAGLGLIACAAAIILDVERQCVARARNRQADARSAA